MISFPTSTDSLTNPQSSDYLNSPDHAAQHANANDAIEALEAKVGVDSSAVSTSLDYKIAHKLSKDVSGEIYALTDKTTPLDADVAVIESNADSNAKRKLSWSNIKATLKTYFDGIYSSAVKASGAEIDTGTDDAKFATSKAIRDSGVLSSSVAGEIYALTNKATPVDADLVVIEDSETSPTAYLKKKLSWTNIKATLKSYFDTLYSTGVVTKCGVATRAFDAATGTQNIAHGLGVAPTCVRIKAVYIASNGENRWSQGIYNGTTMSFVSILAGSFTYFVNSGTSLIVNLQQTSGAFHQDATVTVDATNIILSWTRVGATNSGDMILLWEASK